MLHAHLSLCLTVRKNQSTKYKLRVSRSVYTAAVYHCIALFICSCFRNSVGGLINFLSREDLFGLTCWTCASQTAAEFTFTSRYRLRSSADNLSNHQSSLRLLRGKDLGPLFKITFKFKMKNYLTKLWQIQHQSRPPAGRTRGKLTGATSQDAACDLKSEKKKKLIDPFESHHATHNQTQKGSCFVKETSCMSHMELHCHLVSGWGNDNRLAFKNKMQLDSHYTPHARTCLHVLLKGAHI